MTRPRITRALSAIALATTLAMGGCVLVVESDSHYRFGELHDGTALDEIRPGITTRTWIVNNLGQPDSAYLNEAGNEVLRYVTVHEQDTEVAFFLLFDIDVSEEEVKTLHVEIEGDWVKSFWLES